MDRRHIETPGDVQPGAGIGLKKLMRSASVVDARPLDELRDRGEDGMLR